MKTNKYIYCYVIRTNWGYGWEDECAYDRTTETFKQVNEDAKEYRLAGAQVRVVEKRYPNPSYKEAK